LGIGYWKLKKYSKQNTQRSISRCGADGTLFFIEKPEAELQYKSEKE
jgi:hypothetical protein